MAAADIIVAIEFLVPCLLALSFAVGHTLTKGLFKCFMFLLVLVQLTAVSLRPAEYNSDTWNYSGYVDALSSASGMEYLLLTKFEPVHLLIAAIGQSFRGWLLLEGMIAAGLLGALIWRSRRMETLAAVIGTSLPLMSSSVRFAIGVLSVACVLSMYRNKKRPLVLTSLVGAATHISLAIAGLVERRRWLLTWAILLAFFVTTLVVASILERAGVSETDEARPTGMRTFICLLALMLYLRSQLPSYRKRLFQSDLLSGVAVFALSASLFPVVNRWLVLLLVVVAVDSDARLDAARVPRRTGALAALVLYAALVAPFLFSVARQVATGEWYVSAPQHPGACASQMHELMDAHRSVHARSWALCGTGALTGQSS